MALSSKWVWSAGVALVALVASGCGGGGGGSSTTGGLYMVEDNNENGLYRLDTTTGVATPLGTSGTSSGTDGLTETGNANELVGSVFRPFVRIATNGSSATEFGTSEGAEGLAYDPNTGTYYAVLNADVFTFDPTTGDRIATLSAAPDDVEGLTYGGPGILYGLVSNSGSTDGDLYRYTIATDEWQLIANCGVAFIDCGLAYDPAAGILYAKGSQDENLYRLDPVTAAATVVGPTGVTGGGGLAFVSP